LRLCLDLSDEAVTSSGLRLNISRVFWIIAERGAQFLDRTIQAPLEVHEDIFRPQSLLQFLASNHLACTLHPQ
jgi:hypothetical protein